MRGERQPTPYSDSNPWYLQKPENLPEEWIGMSEVEMKERIGEMISMGYLFSATNLLIGPARPEDLPTIIDPEARDEK